VYGVGLHFTVMRRPWGLAFLLLLAAVRGATAGDCVDPRAFADSVVKVERAGQPHGQIHWAGSGWFHQSRLVLITNDHVAAKLQLAEHEWRSIQLTTAEAYSARTYVQATQARLLARDAANDVALVLLDHPAMGVHQLDLKTGPVSGGEPLAIAGYPSGLLHFGTARASSAAQPIARYRQPRSQFAIDVQGDANLEAFSAGASGSPVLDCTGAVAGIFSNYIDERYLSLFGAFGEKGKPTGRVAPNAFAIKAETLRNFYAGLGPQR
jgi:S1-C subfamily serine protease